VTKSKLWVSLAAGAVLALALGSAALATDLTDTNAESDPGAPHATLPDKASSVAKAVLAALTAGTNPSTVASKDADETKTDNDTDKTADNDADTDNDTGKSPTGSTGAKPGWGCGDNSRTHNGPPGRPGATMPPACKSQ